MECLSVRIVIIFYQEIQITEFLTGSFLFVQIPITLQKEPGVDPEGREVLKCGFKIGGGIDQDYRKSPQGYTDNVGLSFGAKMNRVFEQLIHPFLQGIYVTEVHGGSPAAKSGLRTHDKILQVRNVRNYFLIFWLLDNVLRKY